MIDEHRGAFMCRSSTIAVLADSGPFGALLLTVLGVLERFTRFAIPGVRLCVGYQHSPFCPNLVRLVDYYS